MKIRSRIPQAIAIAAIIALGMISPRAEAGPSGAQTIIDWNQIAQQNIGGPPFSQTRSYAMVHIAMADAAIAVSGKYDPFFAKLKPRSSGASAKAAAAQAAHDVLVALVPPANKPALDAALEASLAKIPFGQKWNGIKIGQAVAVKVLAWRQNDGFALSNPQPPAFLASTLPGIWRQTTDGPPGAAQFSELGNVEPFGLLSATQFLPVPAPQLESAEYADDFNDVKDIGGKISAVRTPDEERLALLFAAAPNTAFFNATNPFRLWNNVARDVSLARKMSLVETARMFALLNASIHDSVLTSHTSKFIYRLWRPVTAIVAADIDDNAATTADPGWVPLLGTPPYPSHASNMSCIGTGAAQMLGNVFGTDSVPFTAVWYDGASPPAVVSSQSYNSLWAMGHDEGSSRIWGGIHYRFEITASEVSCTQVANYLFDNYMQRSGRH
jgi:hypothetical protein